MNTLFPFRGTSGDARDAELTLTLVRSSPRALALTGHCNGSLHLGHYPRSPLQAQNVSESSWIFADDEVNSSHESPDVASPMALYSLYYKTTCRIKYGLGTEVARRSDDQVSQHGNFSGSPFHIFLKTFVISRGIQHLEKKER